MEKKITKDLTPKSRYFASNGLYDFSLKGESKHLDYSTISIQYVKSLEVELGSIFKLLLDSVPRELIENIEPDRLGIELDDYYKNGKMFSIGIMNYSLMQLKKISKAKDSLNLFNPILVHIYKLLNSSDDFSYLYYVSLLIFYIGLPKNIEMEEPMITRYLWLLVLNVKKKFLDLIIFMGP